MISFLLAACGAAALMTASIYFQAVARGVSEAHYVFLQFIGLAISVVAVTLVPAAIVATIGEVFRLRSVWFYAGVAVVVSIVLHNGLRWLVIALWPSDGSVFFVSWTMLIAGLIAGIVYWLLAGRRAGLWLDQRRSTNPDSESAKIG